MREPWVRFLAWSEVVSGAAGVLSYLWLLALYPGIPTLSALLALTFFGANVVAGYRLLRGRGSGARLSFVLQILQVLVLNAGVAYIARAGLHVTFAIASTGAGFFAGPSASFAAVSSSNGGGFNAAGIGYALTLGWWVEPIQQAGFAIGINFVALFFTMRLWRSPLLTHEDPVPPVVSLRSSPIYRRWALPVFMAVLVVVGLWVALGGYDRLTKPNPRWALPNGDTVEILVYNNQYEASYRIQEKTVQASHYLWVQFRSDLTDRDRDHGAAVAVAQVVCPHADSLDIHRVQVQPSRTRFWGFYRYTRTYWFEAGPAGRCEETADG